MTQEIKTNSTLSTSPQLPLQVDLAPILSKISNQRSKLYLGPEDTKVPAITNILYLPLEAYSAVKSVYRAYKIGDLEGLCDNTLRSIEAPVIATHSLLQLASTISQLSILFKAVKNSFLPNSIPMAPLLSITGLLLCALEGTLESLHLGRQINFFKSQFNFDPKGENAYLTQLSRLYNSVFTLSEEKLTKIALYAEKNLQSLTSEEREKRLNKICRANLETQKNALTRRVHHWLSDRIQSQAPTLIAQLQSFNEQERAAAVKKTAALFEQIKIQSHKKFLIHSTGIASVVFTGVGIILNYAGVTLPLAIVLMIIGGILSCVRYALCCGYLDSEGWNFSVRNCFPVYLVKFAEWIHEKVTEAKTAAVYSAPAYAFHSRRAGQLDYTLTLPAGYAFSIRDREET